MLSEIIKILEERGSMTLSDLATHFQMDVSAMEGMLETLKAKGKVELIDSKCATCKGCAMIQREDALIYKIG